MSTKLSDALYFLVILLCITLIIILARIINLYSLIINFFRVCTPILFGYIIAWILYPLYKRLSTKLNKQLSLVTIVATLLALYAFIILLFIPIFLRESDKFINLMSSYLQKFKKIPFIKMDENVYQIKFNTIMDSAGGLIHIVVNFAFSNLFGFYILYNYKLINLLGKKYLPKRYRNIILRFIHKLSLNMHQYVKGTIIDSLVLFFITFIMFSIFNFRYALLISFFISITNIIPFIGPYIGGLPAIIIGLSYNLKMGVIALIIVFILQVIESNLINPLIMSKVTKINPLFILITVTLMSKIFGVLGMIFAVPLLIFVKILNEFINKYKLKKLT